MTAPVDPAEKNPPACPFFDRAATEDDRGLAARHDRGDGVVLHGDDLGCDQRLGALVRRAELGDDLLGARDDDLKVRIGLERGHDARKHDLRRLVAANRVDAHANLIHVNPLDREMADSPSRPY